MEEADLVLRFHFGLINDDKLLPVENNFRSKRIIISGIWDLGKRVESFSFWKDLME